MAGRRKLPSQLTSKIKKPKPFEWSDSLQVAVEKRAYGHAKAGALLARIVSQPGRDGRTFIYHLSKLDFYGEDIWWGFENFCRSDIEYFKAVVELEDTNFRNAVLDWKAQQALNAMNGEK